MKKEAAKNNIQMEGSDSEGEEGGKNQDHHSSSDEDSDEGKDQFDSNVGLKAP
jgi:hypothetical protein